MRSRILIQSSSPESRPRRSASLLRRLRCDALPVAVDRARRRVRRGGKIAGLARIGVEGLPVRIDELSGAIAFDRDVEPGRRAGPRCAARRRERRRCRISCRSLSAAHRRRAPCRRRSRRSVTSPSGTGSRTKPPPAAIPAHASRHGFGSSHSTGGLARLEDRQQQRGLAAASSTAGLPSPVAPAAVRRSGGLAWAASIPALLPAPSRTSAALRKW